eukprot:PhM_4_TR4105/c0_g1_i1/m.9317
MSRPGGKQAVFGSNQQPSTPPPPPDPTKQAVDTLKELKRLYDNVLKPLEAKSQYDSFRPSWFSEILTLPKPMVTFLGPFSSGKSSFINYLLQGNYLQTGPQPTTDKFNVIMHGEEHMVVPGRILAAAADQPFRGLQHLGDAFLECFGGVQVPHELLRSVTLVDTPGVLEAAGGVHARRYDYVRACRWFVERSDLVFILFDPTKLDAGNELRMMFKHALKNCEGKVRIVLNKSDSVGPQELMKVYGSLFWNLSTLVNTTEPPRVYVSSFWDKPYQPLTNGVLFTEEKGDLLYDLTELAPLQCVDKKVAAMVRRCQDVLIHAYVVGTIRHGMPMLFGKDKARRQAMENLEKTFEIVAGRYRLVIADFPQPSEYRAFFDKTDIYELPSIDALKPLIDQVRRLVEEVLPRLLKPIQSAEANPSETRRTALMLQRQYMDPTLVPIEQRERAVHTLGAGAYAQQAAAPGPTNLGGGAGGMMLPQDFSREQIRDLIGQLQLQERFLHMKEESEKQ